MKKVELRNFISKPMNLRFIGMNWKKKMTTGCSRELCIRQPLNFFYSMKHKHISEFSMENSL